MDRSSTGTRVGVDGEYMRTIPLRTPRLLFMIPADLCLRDLQGDKDPDWSNPLKEAEWVASNFKESKVVAVPGAGHGPQMENPQVVAESILEQLTRLRVEGAFQRRPQ